MISIDRLRLRLPAGYEHRAAAIASLVGESLRHYRIDDRQNLEHLKVGPLRLGPNATDRDVADQVARGIARSLGAKL